MDTISETAAEAVTLMCSAQVGKTEILNNVVGFHIDQDPAPILILQPTIDIAETWSKDRLAPMLRDTPCLADKVSDAKSRDSGNTILHKVFPGGQLTAVGANSPSGLAARPIRIVLADEVDRYPASAGTEGDPLSLAIKRTTTFWNRLIVKVSTPTIKGLSRIERDFLASDQRYYLVPCVHCGVLQRLVWARVRWPEGDPGQAAYHCEACDVAWTEADRLAAVRAGEWRVTNPAGRWPGFQISELYSPWSTIVRIAHSFVDAQKSAETRRVWVNTVLGEPYETDAEIVDHHVLADPSRLEEWPEDKAPQKCLLVTVGVDVQGDRLEVERVGWGNDEESWSLEHVIMPGDPSDPELWRQLDAYLMEPTIRADGRQLFVRAACVDSGGHHTKTVYAFARLRRKRGVYAIKGVEHQTTIWPSAYQRSKSKAPDVITIGVSTAKDAIYSRLKVSAPGPGYCHFPKGRSVVWFEQLTAEVVQTRYVRGFPKRVYVLPEGRRNEALDCRVYAYSALQSLGVRWGTELMASRLTTPAALKPQVERASAAAQAMQLRPRPGPTKPGGFLGRPRPGGFLKR